MRTFQELDSVRVARLLTPDRPFSSSTGRGRPPAVGDSGVVVMVRETTTGRSCLAAHLLLRDAKV